MRLISFLLVLPLAATAFSRDARAAACCGTGHGLGQRLGPGESAALSLATRFADRFGSYDPQGNFFTIPAESLDADLRTDLSFIVSPLSRLQIGLTAPFVLNIKHLGADRDVGGGLGDLVFSGRFEILALSTANAWPAISFTAAVTLPTGRSANDAQQKLAADATGLGVAEVRPGVFFEKSFGGKASAIVAGSVGIRSESHVPPASRVMFAPRWRLLAAAGPIFESGLSLSFGGIYEYEGAPSIDGTTTVDAQRRRAAVLGFVGYDLPARFTLLGSVELDLPLRYFGKNEAASVAISIGLRRSFFWEK